MALNNIQIVSNCSFLIVLKRKREREISFLDITFKILTVEINNIKLMDLPHSVDLLLCYISSEKLH